MSERKHHSSKVTFFQMTAVCCDQIVLLEVHQTFQRDFRGMALRTKLDRKSRKVLPMNEEYYKTMLVIPLFVNGVLPGNYKNIVL